MQEDLTLRLIYLKPPGEWAHKRAGLALVFPKEGGGKYVCGRVAKRLAAGDVLVSSGGRGGRVHVSNGCGMVFRYFSLSLEHLFPLFAVEEISLLDNVADNLNGFRLYPASSPVAKECHRLLGQVSPQFDLGHRSQLLRIATVILTEEFRTARRQRVGSPRPEHDMVQRLENLPADELLGLSVEKLAGKLGCSRRHLNRLFHQHFGFSLAALRMDMRMMKAVSLLRNPDAKVLNVAEQCGFHHPGLFNTCFKKRFGTSPSQWRKQNYQAESSSSPPTVPSSACLLHSSGLCPWAGKTPRNDSETSREMHSVKPSPTSVFAGTGSLGKKRGQATA